MARSRSLPSASLLVISFLLALAAASVCEAQTCTWTGGGTTNNWSDAANWSTNPTLPTTGDNLIFGGSTRVNPNVNDLTGGTSFASITFGLGAGDFVITGNAIVLSGGATALSSNATSGTMTLNCNLTFSTAAPTITSTSGGTLALGGTIDNGGLLLTVVAGGPTRMGGLISGAGGLAKTGANTLTLSGANSYGGGTTVSDGSIVANNDAAFGTGTITGNGGTITSNDGVAKTFSNAITVPAGKTFRLYAPGTGGGQDITLTGALSGADLTSVLFIDGNSDSSSVYVNKNNQTTWFGTIQLGSSNSNVRLKISSSYSLGQYTKLIVDQSGDLGGIESPITGAFGGLYYDIVINAGKKLNIGQNSGAVTTLPLRGVISGDGDFNKYGTTITMPIYGSNTYTGKTSLKEGTIQIYSLKNVSGGASSLGAPTTAANGTIAIGSGANTGTLYFAGAGCTTDRVIDMAGTTGGVNITNNGLFENGSGPLVFTSALTASGAGAKTLTLTGNGTGTSSIINIPQNGGATSFVKDGTSTWQVSGTNTITGTVLINGGVFIHNGVLSCGAVSFGSSAYYTPCLDGLSTLGRITSSGTVTCSGNLDVFSVVNGGLGTVYTVFSAASVTGTFSGLANGALVTAAGRTFQIAYDTVSNPNNVTLTEVPHNTTRTWDGGGTDNNFTTAANWDGDVAPAIGDDLVFDGATRPTPNNNYTANTRIKSITFAAGAGSFTIGGNAFMLQGNITDNSTNAQTISVAAYLTPRHFSTVHVASGGSLTIGSRIGYTGYGAVLTKTGAGTLTLAADNMQFNACILHITAGKVILSTSTRALYTNSIVQLDNESTASLELGINSSIFFLYGGGASGGNIDLKTYSLTTAWGPTLPGENPVITYAGVISGSAGCSFIKNGAGTLTLTGTNTYPGTTTIGAGTLQIGDGITDGSISTSSGITNNAALIYNLVGSQSYGNAIGGGGTLTKTGAGTLTFTGTNTYTGATTVSAGTLRVTGQTSPNSGTGTGSVAVNAGGTLSGNGRIAGPVTVASSNTAVLYPNSSATLTLGDNLTFNANSTAKFNLSSSAAGANDKVVLENKTLTCAGASITINSAGTLDTTTDYVLFDVGTTGTISGSFSATPVWTGTTPPNAANYGIAIVGKQVVLHFAGIPVTVTATVNSKAYDGTTSAAAVPTITSGSLRLGDVATWTETYDTKSVGTGKTLTPTGTVRDGSNNDVTSLYAITFTPVNTGVISARAITVTATTNTKTYDQTTSAAAVPAITSGSLAAGDVGTWTETYDTKNVGTGKTLTPAGTVRDTLNNNVTSQYAITFAAAATGTITQRPLTVTATGVNKVYDGNTNATVNLQGNYMGGDTITLNYSQATFDTKNVGVGKTVSVYGITVGGADAGNYALQNTFTTTTANITARALAVSATGVDKIYDGTTSATVTLSSNKVAGDTLTFGYTATFATKDVGNGKTVTVTGISLVGADAGNYTANASTTTTANITPKALTVTGLTAASKTYNGTTTATLSGTASLQAGEAPGTGTTADGRPYTGDTVSVTGTPVGTFSDPLVANNKAVTVSGLSLTGAQAGNYTLTPLILYANIGSKAAVNKRL